MEQLACGNGANRFSFLAGDTAADPDQPAGRVVLAGTRAGVQHAALVELKLSALVNGQLHAGGWRDCR